MITASDVQKDGGSFIGDSSSGGDDSQESEKEEESSNDEETKKLEEEWERTLTKVMKSNSMK